MEVTAIGARRDVWPWWSEEDQGKREREASGGVRVLILHSCQGEAVVAGPRRLHATRYLRRRRGEEDDDDTWPPVVSRRERGKGKREEVGATWAEVGCRAGPVRGKEEGWERAAAAVGQREKRERD
jgi:hypothetical protein